MADGTALDNDDDALDDDDDDALDDDGAFEEPLPPWAAKASAARQGQDVPSLQTILCGFLSRHLHLFESLDDLPEHLASIVRSAIERDHRLLTDEGLGVWLEAASRGGSTTKLNLRWAAKLSDAGMKCFADSHYIDWARSLVELDLAFCDAISDAGVQDLAPCMPALRALILTGCTKLGDGACKAVGHHCPSLERCELELMQRTTDIGVQALVRGCPGLSDLRVGGCSRLSNISTSLIADHCSSTMRRLGLGGCSALNDLDLEDVGKVVTLTWLDLCACPKVSDAGIKQIGMLAARQMKAYALWEDNWGGATAAAAVAGAPAPSVRSGSGSGGDCSSGGSAGADCSGGGRCGGRCVPGSSGVGSGASAARCLRGGGVGIGSGVAGGAGGSSAPVAGGVPPPPPTLQHLDLGGLGRLSDTGLQKLLVRTRCLTSLDLRGCSRLTEDGLAVALANCDGSGARVAGVQLVPRLERLTLLSLEAASERVVSHIVAARPSLHLVS
jgi:hypothetical protein